MLPYNSQLLNNHPTLQCSPSLDTPANSIKELNAPAVTKIPQLLLTQLAQHKRLVVFSIPLTYCCSICRTAHASCAGI